MAVRGGPVAMGPAVVRDRATACGGVGSAGTAGSSVRLVSMPFTVMPFVLQRGRSVRLGVAVSCSLAKPVIQTSGHCHLDLVQS